MAMTRSAVSCCRCPFVRRLFLRRRFLKTISLASRTCSSHTHVTLAPGTKGRPSTVRLVEPSRRTRDRET